MAAVDVKALARELMHAHVNGQIIAIPPSSRDSEFDLTTAYAVEAELVRLRQGNGRRTVGRKVGFANKALWRRLELGTLVWPPCTITRCDSPKTTPRRCRWLRTAR